MATGKINSPAEIEAIANEAFALLSHDEGNQPLTAGEIVTTGTLTRALPVAAGEAWTTELIGVGLDGIRVRFA